MENNLHEPKNIAGLSSLINDDDIASNVDLSELEKEIANGINLNYVDKNKKENDVDFADEYKQEIERITRNYELDNNFSSDVNNAKCITSDSIDDDIVDNDFDGSIDINASHDNSFHNNAYENTNIILEKNIYNDDNTHFDDKQLNNMTNEQTKQEKINKVLRGIDDKELEFNIEKEKDEDDKASLFEQIDMLKTTLEDEGIDVSGVPNVNKNSNIKDVQNVYKILRLKNDRNRYCSFAEELILSGAYGLEYVFDGKKEWFGRKPDLIGWPDTVKVKLRRMRYETSTFVQDVMQEYNMSSGVRLALELLPSMFLYSRNRRISQQDNLISDSEYKSAINNMNDI